MDQIDLDKIGNADLRGMSVHRPDIHSPQRQEKNDISESKILHVESNLAQRYFCGHTAQQHDLHGKCTKMTKTKWDKFSPYSFHKLSNQEKDQIFLQLYENYRGTKGKLNQQVHKVRRLNTEINRLQAQISKLKSKGATPGQNYKIFKQKNQETDSLKQEIKRLHQKIMALTGTNKNFFKQRPKTANKPQKQIIPVNQNLKAQLQQQRKHVRQLLLIIDELKKNKFDVQQMLKNKQATQGNKSNLRVNRINNKSKIMGVSTQSQFQQYANDLHTWKQKYSDLQLAFNRMNEDKDRKLREISTQLIALKQNQRMKQRLQRRGPAFDLSEAGKNEQKIKQITLQKQKLQDELRRLVQMPFYQNNRQIVDAQQKIKNLQLKYAKVKDQIVKLNESNTKFISELEYKKKQNQLLKNQNEKVKKQLKQFMEKQQAKVGSVANNLDYDDYYRKILALVKLQGDDPVWKKFQSMAKPDIRLMTEQKVKQFAQKLWINKLQLLAYLEKAQIQLRTMKQGMDARINLYIRDKQTLQEELKITRARLDQWKCMDNINQRRTYKFFQQAGIKYDDTVSVFDIDEKQMRDLDSTENYFDLYLGNLNIDESVLLKNPQNRVKNTSHFISFLTIDFYNHETQHSNFAEGVMKRLGNNYSFKVEINSYFLKFLSKNTVTLQLWSPQGTATVLLGKGQIYLSQLINKAAQDISSVVRGKCQIYYSDKILIATVQYRFRMRLPIFQFIEWAENKHQFKASQSRDPFIVGKRRIMEFSIERAEGLPANMVSFVYFNVQEQDFFTQPERGASPYWNYKQEIPVTVDQQFTNDLKQKYFEFTVFDDSKEVNQDIYGIAKANLTPLINQTDSLDLMLDIEDRNGDKNGKLKIRVKWLTF